jgi:hypothetical protein
VEDIMFVKPKLIELIVAGDDKDTSIFLKSNKHFREAVGGKFMQ